MIEAELQKIVDWSQQLQKKANKYLEIHVRLEPIPPAYVLEIWYMSISCKKVDWKCVSAFRSM